MSDELAARLGEIEAFPLPVSSTPPSEDVASGPVLPDDCALWGIQCKPRGPSTPSIVLLAPGPKDFATMTTADGSRLLERLPGEGPIAVGEVAKEWVPLLFFRAASLIDATRSPTKFVLTYVGEHINLGSLVIKPRSEVVRSVAACSAFAFTLAADAFQGPLYVVPAVGQALAIANYIGTLASANECVRSLMPFASRAYDYIEREGARVRRLEASIVQVSSRAGESAAAAERRRLELAAGDPVGRLMDAVIAPPPIDRSSPTPRSQLWAEGDNLYYIIYR